VAYSSFLAFFFGFFCSGQPVQRARHASSTASQEARVAPWVRGSGAVLVKGKKARTSCILRPFRVEDSSQYG
jgi:hypothetical protein